jgi:hypothetical protein
MLAAFDCAVQYVCRLAILIEAKQAHRTGAATDHVQLFVCCNEVIDEQSRSRICIRKQARRANNFDIAVSACNDRACGRWRPDAE